MNEPARPTILVLAYSISPVRGSEYAVGWNYVTHMSRDNNLIVLYGLAGDHMGDFEEIENMPADRFGGRVSFVPVTPDWRARAANYLNRTGHVPFSFYIGYRFWHRTALAVARRLIGERRIDVVHYLCPIGYREPGYLWQLGLPYIWGPIGGMNLRPVRAFRQLSLSSGLRTMARNTANWIQFRASPRLRRAIRVTDLLIANTSENRSLIQRVFGRRPEVLPENAIVGRQPARRPGPPGTPLRLIWVGRLDQAKAPEILIEALAPLKGQDWHLTVVGTGPRADAIAALARDRGLDGQITWTGRMARRDVALRFAEADVHVLTSLAEAHSTVLFEAMSAGVPTIAIDHCGMHDSICTACGIRIPLDDIDVMSIAFAQAIGELVADRRIAERLSAGAHVCAERYGWEHRRAFWQDAYRRAIAINADRAVGR